jgi:hypothetical protein
MEFACEYESRPKWDMIHYTGRKHESKLSGVAISENP